MLEHAATAGRNAGQFHHVHDVVEDSNGNLYRVEVETGRRIKNLRSVMDRGMKTEVKLSARCCEGYQRARQMARVCRVFRRTVGGGRRHATAASLRIDQQPLWGRAAATN